MKPQARRARRQAVARPGLLRRLAHRLGLVLVAVLPGGVATVVATGFVVEGLQPPLERSDAIIVISGDEDQARLRQGLRLWRESWAPRLIFSGAARAGPVSNAEAMRRRAIADGVPASAVLVDDQGADTYGNAVHTRRIMVANGLGSAILVTSPYHLQRAAVTFNGVYSGSGIRLIASAAPDSDWRKQSWWLRSDLRLLTLQEIEKLAYIALTGRYN